MRQHSDQADPPWPPPPPTEPVLMSYEEVLGPAAAAAAGGGGGAAAAADAAPVRPELRFWERALPQCVAADARPRSFGFAKVAAGSEEAAAVKQHWDAGIHAGTRFQMLGCYRLQSTPLYRRFRARREEMQQALVDDGLDPSLLQVGFYWHGPSSLHALEGVIQSGFDRLYASTGANALGVGTYFAKLAELSANSYAANVCDVCVGGGCGGGGSVCAILLCAVLFDEVSRGEKNRFPPPRKTNSRTGARFNATGDRDYSGGSSHLPGVLVTYHDGQALPLYVVTFTRT